MFRHVSVILLTIQCCFIIIDSRSLKSSLSTSDSIVISPRDLVKFSKINKQNGLDAFQQLARALKACGLKSTTTHAVSTTAMTKIMIKDTKVTCNDGSSIGYYIRRSYGSKRWIVFLEGGWYCFDKKSCDSRWLRMQSLMSSKFWPDTKHVNGILSSDPEENPYWWNANHVFVPYCSSDSWSGTARSHSNSSRFSFMGSYIVQEVIKDLLPKGLFNAKRLYLAGSSAGGTGVILNLDRVADLLSNFGSRVQVRGITDSGWFIDNKPFQEVDCTGPQSCAPMIAVKKGIELWSGRVADSCKLQYPGDEMWKCYLGYRSYPSIRAPLFVFQWLFDEAQMAAGNVGAPVTKSQWNYIHRMGSEIRQTFKNVTAVFAPSCISHTVLIKREWQNIKINGISLPQAIKCWEDQRHEHNHHNHHPSHHHHHRLHIPKTKNITLSILNDMPLNRKLLIQRLLSSKKNEMSQRKQKERQNIKESIATNNPSRRRKNRRRHRRRRKNRKRRHRNRKRKERRGRKNRQGRSSVYLADDHYKHRFSHHRDACDHRVIDRCSWPQCNPTCPKLHNPFTGEEMDFMELLKSFGLDIKNIATALGVDIETLNQMDHGTLLRLLTQRVTD